MPIYEYRCENGHNFEVMQRMSDDPVSACATCGVPVQRVFHPPSVHFKGSGFYNTDYGTKKRAREQRENGSSGESKESKSSDSGSSDSKSTSSDSGSSSSGGESKSSGDSGKKSDGAAKASA